MTVPLPIGREITLTINLLMIIRFLSQSSLKRRALLLPSARVAWQYYGGSEKGRLALPGGAGRRDISFYLQRAYNLPFAGRNGLTFIHPAHDRGRYWLCCSLRKTVLRSSRISRISTNTLSASHRDLVCGLPFDGSGLPGQVFVIENSLAWYGHLDLQVQEPDGSWRYWEQVADLAQGKGDGYIYTLIREEDSCRLLISFGDGQNGRIPPAGTGNIRAIVTAPSFRLRRLLGRSNGLPGQIFRLAGLNQLLEQTLLLQVGKKLPGQKQMY